MAETVVIPETVVPAAAVLPAAWWVLPQPATTSAANATGSTTSLVTSGIVPYASVDPRRKEVRR